METILSLSPKALWKNFHSLTQIPRPSAHTKAVSDFLVNFGKELGLETKQDEMGNVFIKKPATPGMEEKPTVILQGHIDMVPQKNNDTIHDFEKDPIQTIIDGGWVKAKGTTLGADNGIGVAAAMAVLETEDLVHGPVAALFTVDEETGMFGAFGLQPGFAEGNILLNLDTEEEGDICVGCAGGTNVNINLEYKEEAAPEGDIAYKIALTGLRGGHSGVEIHEGRANANKEMFRFLKDAVAELDMCLSSAQGGNMHNAIPREAYAIVTLQPENEEAFLEMVDDFEDMLVDEYEGIEDMSKLGFDASKCAMPEFIIPEEIQDSIIQAINACPNGVERMVPLMPTTVESSDNLSIVEVGGGKMHVLLLARSSSESRRPYICSSIESAFAITGAKVAFEGDYPGWDPNPDSKILKALKANYEKMYGKEPNVGSIHAGLECGIIGASVPGLDMVSFGPTICHPHSPDEKVDIATVERFWELLTITLAKI